MVGRIKTIDALKGLATIAVVLYHLGNNIFPYGYLGVDAFFVVSGYFLMKELCRANAKSNFSFIQFVYKKILRLWPLLLVVILWSMVLGFFLMLPDDYENLSESAIASSVFANNILSCITTRNYWNVVNQYKPLMHTWYVSVLMQAYIILGGVFWVCEKIKKGLRPFIWFITAITIISFTIYLSPSISTAWKFYYIPFRLFEITLGMLVFYILSMHPFASGGGFFSKTVFLLSLLSLIVLFSSRGHLISQTTKLICTDLMTLVFLVFCSDVEWKSNPISDAVAFLGKESYSIYLCHQMIIAFMFYSFAESLSGVSFLAFIILTIGLSYILFKVEERFILFQNSYKNKRLFFMSCCVVFLLIDIISGVMYIRAGVIRDVPELGISTQNITRKMHSAYCDRPYSWDKDFSDGNKTKVLVIGNSFARDFANILFESEYSDLLEISYSYYQFSENKGYADIDRITQADFVFLCVGPDYGDIPENFIKLIPEKKCFVVGNKNFGISNGIFYSRRYTSSYFDQTIEPPDELIKNNEAMSRRYGDRFIDMLSIVQDKKGNIRIFSDDKHFFSQDCKHLTPFGACYYAKHLTLGFLTQPNK